MLKVGPYRYYPSWITGLRYPSPDGLDRRTYIAQHVSVSDALELRAEPHNRHDSDAVAYFHRGHHLGYVPRDHHWVSRALDDGDMLQAIVVKIKRSWWWPSRRVRKVVTEIGIKR